MLSVGLIVIVAVVSIVEVSIVEVAVSLVVPPLGVSLIC